MSTSRFIITAVASGFFVGGMAAPPAAAQEAAPRQASQAESDQEEVLTRGPVHEAFATAVIYDPEPGLTISVKPPELIDELPPEQQLEGDNVAWIPGYWAWDEEREDFLWISGIWRNLPPDRQWVPGYWDDLGGTRYQWISGYWADATVSEVSYLPEPPKPLESRPNADAPSSSHTWIPGNWVWVDTRYRWRPGYWEPLRENWTYVPDHYHWTPRGYVYVGGYWDYAPVRRGIIFAPVYFSRDYYRRDGFRYTPSIVISINTVVDHLFVRPRYGHYYFGDYYEPRYRQEGFVASFTVGSGSSVFGYDPIYAYARWSHRDDRDWERRRREDFDYFRDHRDARPPRNWGELRDLGDGRRGAKIRDRDYMVAAPLAEFAKAPEKGERFRKLEGDARERVMNRRKEMQEFRQERRQQEDAGKRDGQKPQAEEKVKLGRSPILGRRASELAKDEAPPPRKEAPAPVDPDAAKETPKTADERKQPGEGETQPMPPDRQREGQPQREREAQPQREREGQPQREREGQPQREREGQPQREREAQPQREREAQPQREREAQPQREREAQPQREREAQPKREREAQPQREREAQPQREREAQPQREREAQPKREAQPQREREAQPKREAQPQRERANPRERDKDEKKE